VALGDDLTQAVLADWRTAPVGAPVRAMLGLIEQVTLRPESLSPADVQVVRNAGVSEAAIVDALYICALFNMIDRIADALGFALPADVSKGAGTQLRRGYRM
jgi:alkylhydroperoxidase family enzyme